MTIMSRAPSRMALHSSGRYRTACHQTENRRNKGFPLFHSRDAAVARSVEPVHTIPHPDVHFVYRAAVGIVSATEDNFHTNGVIGWSDFEPSRSFDKHDGDL